MIAKSHLESRISLPQRRLVDIAENMNCYWPRRLPTVFSGDWTFSQGGGAFLRRGCRFRYSPYLPYNGTDRLARRTGVATTSLDSDGVNSTC
jgi:hypothetical protein